MRFAEKSLASGRNNKMFEISEIMRNIPHRHPFLLIDRVLEFEADESITTLKNISVNEFQFQGHFPGFSILPGVFIIEAMAQSACFLLKKSISTTNDNRKIFCLAKVSRMSFTQPVYPGDQLVTKVIINKRINDQAIVAAASSVNGELSAKGELVFSTLNHASG